MPPKSKRPDKHPADESSDEDEDFSQTPLASQMVDDVANQLVKKPKQELVDAATRLGTPTGGNKALIANGIAVEKVKRKAQGRGRQPGEETVKRRKLSDGLIAASVGPAQEHTEDPEHPQTPNENPKTPNAPAEPVEKNSRPLGRSLTNLVIENEADLSITKVSSMPKEIKNRRAIEASWAPDQEIIVCTICCHAWSPKAQVKDVCDHIEGTRHAGKKNAAEQNTLKDDNLTEMWKVDASAIALKLARGSLFSGVAPARLQVALEPLAGVRIPAAVPNITTAVAKHSATLWEEARRNVKERLQGKRYSLFHDDGTVGTFKSTSVSLVGRSVGVSLFLIPKKPVERADQLKEAILQELEQLGVGLPFLLRSDRGGKNGALSRTLALLLGMLVDHNHYCY